MNGIALSRNKSGFLAFAVLVALLFSLMWSAAGANAGVAASCSAQVDRAVDALTSGVTIDAAEARKLQGCVLSQPAQTADALGLGQADGATTQTVEATSATVVATFWTLAGIGWCVDFNSDGTIAGRPTVPAVSGLGGGYVGTPGSFTLFVITFVSGGNAVPVWVGVSIGPVLMGVSIIPQNPFLLVLGFQISSC
jgi:hypothetical protein